MVIRYTTKRNSSGNRKTLIVDHSEKTFSRGYNTSFDYSDYITIGDNDRTKLCIQLEVAGYTEVLKIY